MALPVVLTGAAELAAAVGTDLGTSAWHTVDQRQIDSFADATGDRYWIHVDPQRAAAGPFGATIAHGFLTLSLLPQLKDEVVRVVGFDLTVNYGTDRVRFPAPLRVGTPIRVRVTLDDVQVLPGGATSTMTLTCLSESSAKPHCVATVLNRYFDADPGAAG